MATGLDRHQYDEFVGPISGTMVDTILLQPREFLPMEPSMVSASELLGVHICCQYQDRKHHCLIGCTFCCAAQSEMHYYEVGSQLDGEILWLWHGCCVPGRRANHFDPILPYNITAFLRAGSHICRGATTAAAVKTAAAVRSRGQLSCLHSVRGFCPTVMK